MKQNNSIMRGAIAACFGLAAPMAMAAVNLNATTAAPVKIASEIPSTTTTLTNVGDLLGISFNNVSGYLPTSSNPMYVKVALLNGAKFASAPNLWCDATASGPISGTITLGGAASETVTFKVATAAGDIKMTGQCYVSGFDTTISGLTNKTVSAVLEYTDGASPASVARTGSYITFVRSMGATVAAQATGVVVDAASGSDNFVVGSNLGMYSAVLGSASFRIGYAGSTAVSASGASVTDNALSTATVTVSGPAIAAAKAFGVSGVSLSTTTACDGNVANSFNSSGATSVTFNSVTPSQISAGVMACMQVPATGGSIISTGQITITVGGTPLTNVTVDTSATSNNGANITANGSTRNAYLVNASTSASKTSVIRLVNKSGISGAITATAYNEAGTQLGTANASLGTLANNQMLTKTSAELEAALGFTPASGTSKYSVVFSGALPNFEVLNFSKDASGAITLSNTSTTSTQ